MNYTKRGLELLHPKERLHTSNRALVSQVNVTIPAPNIPAIATNFVIKRANQMRIRVAVSQVIQIRNRAVAS